MLPKIAERRANPGDDLLSTLCTAEIDGEQMSDLEIKAFVSLLLVAGGETTDKAHVQHDVEPARRTPTSWPRSARTAA